MIESIAITNFYCFKEKTELSFVAGRERNRDRVERFKELLKVMEGCRRKNQYE